MLACVLAVVLAPYAGTALIVSLPVNAPDAIVSLASHEWERLPEAARQARAYPAARVILTLPQSVSIFNCHDCTGRIGRLVRLGVDRQRIVMVPLTSGGTHGEALACLDYIRDTGIKRVLVVTTPYHTRRSLATFRTILGGLGVEVGVQPTQATAEADPAHWWRRAYDRGYVGYEWAAAVYYALRYGVSPFA